MFREARCKVPKPKVFPVNMKPAYTYVPHCVYLHRCGNDVGCCFSDTLTCTASKFEMVDLYFTVSWLRSHPATTRRMFSSICMRCTREYSHSDSSPTGALAWKIIDGIVFAIDAIRLMLVTWTRSNSCKYLKTRKTPYRTANAWSEILFVALCNRNARVGCINIFFESVAPLSNWQCFCLLLYCAYIGKNEGTWIIASAVNLLHALRCRHIPSRYSNKLAYFSI